MSIPQRCEAVKGRDVPWCGRSRHPCLSRHLLVWWILSNRRIHAQNVPYACSTLSIDERNRDPDNVLTVFAQPLIAGDEQRF
jgi:hypothetical protein